MTYQETIDFLYQQLPVFHRIGPQAYKPDLTNTLRLCAHLGDPQNQFKAIHVAGTNGKGSTSHMLAAILQVAGYKVGLYTSPHLKDFSERIRINGQPIEPERVIDFVEKNRTFIQNLVPSFFEMTVGMAFQEFAAQRVDVAVVEVGLGGRLDSTNVITPLLSVITNIGYDHMDILGDTLAQIAAEKAGIIKQAVPVVISERQTEVEQIFIDAASQARSPVYFASDRFIVQRSATVDGALRVVVNDRLHRDATGQNQAEWTLELPGLYQVKNLPGVLQAVWVLRERGFEIREEAIRVGLAKTIQLTGLKGRWQKISDQPRILCDTGHNEAGIKSILECVDSFQYRKLWLVLGFVKDKDLSRVMSILPASANYVFCQANQPRALPADELLTLGQSHGLQGIVRQNVNQALEYVRQHADAQSDLVVVGGSTFVVAEINEL